MNAPADRPRRFPWAIYLSILAIIVPLGLAPMILMMIGAGIAEANDCQLDEGSIHPCIINGEDWGAHLYTLAMMGWFMLLSFPVAAMCILVWLIILIVHRLSFRPKSGGAA